MSATKLWQSLAEKLETHYKAPEFQVDTKINMVRRTVSANCRNAASMPCGVFRLDAPTGGGKTLASLRFALYHATAHSLERVIYVIPYLSILEQTAKAIRGALNIDENDNELILEHHSNLLLPDNDKQADGYRLATERWDYPVVITTMVRFLETIYSEKSSDLRRFHNMARAVIIFDEAQSMPIKCVSLFNEAINFLTVFGGSSILLCTATQPPLDECLHPIIATPTKIVVDALSLPQRVAATNAIIKDGYSMERLRDFVLDKLESALNCLVILNTKDDAKQLFKATKEAAKEKGVAIFHLSALMYPKHRSKTIDKIKKALEAKERILAISTQLIEAGVDISFECVIRALAGLDSIAQAAGRCNRHGEYPHVCFVFIINIAKENLDMLPDIKIAAETTIRVLREIGNDLLSQEAIKLYYQYYFYDRRNLMDYNAPKQEGNLYDWLSGNKQGERALKDAKGSKPPQLPQAFESAGKEFSVIDESAVGVVVCHNNEAQKLLNLYENAILSEKTRFLRQLQGFSVSFYKHRFANIKRLVYEIDGVSVLPKKYYDDEIGVKVDETCDYLGADNDN